MEIFEFANHLAEHYRRQHQSSLAGEPDPYEFDATMINQLIPEGSNNTDFIYDFVESLFEAESQRRSVILSKATLLVGAAGISITIGMGLSGFLVATSNEINEWAWIGGIPSILSFLSFVWAATVALGAMRLQAIHVPDPLDLPRLAGSNEPRLLLARDKLESWSRDQAITNEIGFLYTVALERYILGLLFAVGSVVTLSAIAAVA